MTTPRHELTAAEVQRIARLARLRLEPGEVDAARGQLAGVLGYMDRLRALDLSGVEPMAHVGDAVNRLRADVPGATLPNAALMAMAPEATPPFVKVPKVLGDGGGA